MSSTLPAFAALLVVTSACDATPAPVRASGDFFVYDAGAPAIAKSSAYEVLAVRAVSAVGLAEARGLGIEEVKRTLGRIADMLDACVTELGSHGQLGDGSARLVLKITDEGAVGGTLLVPDPNTPLVLATAKLCLEARVKLLPFAPAEPADGGTRGMAIEATWGKLMPH